MSVVLYVRIPEAMKARLEALTAETGLTLTTVTTEVLSRGLRATSAASTGVQRLHEILDPPPSVAGYTECFCGSPGCVWPSDSMPPVGTPHVVGRHG